MLLYVLVREQHATDLAASTAIPMQLSSLRRRLPKWFCFQSSFAILVIRTYLLMLSSLSIFRT